ncbi:hypothetical protein BHM03_00015853 [Ensete ventricosum]|nr:hypothetical protein BHM03_00015853 [Ensete ventricosum]
MIGLASGSGKLRGLWRPEVVAALPRAGPPGSGPLVTPFAGVPPGEPIGPCVLVRPWSSRGGVGARLDGWIPRTPSRGLTVGVAELGSGGGTSGRVRRRLLQEGRVGSLYSGCCRSSVPGNLVALMAYHATVPFHHARRPCGKACVCRWLEKEASRLDGMTRWSHTHTLELLIQLLQVLCVVASFRGHTSGDLKDA